MEKYNIFKKLIMKNKKITFLISSLVGGGAEGVCVNIANALAQDNWQVDLVVLNLKNAAYKERVSSKVNLVNLNVSNARYSFKPIKKYIKENKVEKVLVFNYELAVMLVLIRKLSFVKFKIIARNIIMLSKSMVYNNNLWNKFIVFPFINKFYFKVDHIVNQCKAMEKDLLSIYPQLKGKTSVIYNPVNKLIEDKAKEIDFEIIEKKDYLLCVGRLEEQKAFHYAIEAFAKISGEFPKLRLKIVGQGSLEEKLKELAKKFGVEDKVDFEGFQKDIIPYYLGAKATLLTSLYEGFPNVLIESISLGTPIVAFDCPSGPSEIVVDGENGYLVKYQNIDDLVEKINLTLKKEWDSSLIDSSKKYQLKEILKQWMNKFETVY